MSIDHSSPYKSLAGKRTYTVEEIAKILGIGRTAAYSLVHSGVFKAVRIGSSIRVSKVSFDDWLDKQNAHILDEDRKVNAQKFESAFYANPDLRGVQAPAEPAPALDVQSIILQLQQSPELLSALTSLISNQGCK